MQAIELNNDNRVLSIILDCESSFVNKNSTNTTDFSFKVQAVLIWLTSVHADNVKYIRASYI